MRRSTWKYVCEHAHVTNKDSAGRVKARARIRQKGLQLSHELDDSTVNPIQNLELIFLVHCAQIILPISKHDWRSFNLALY